MTDSASDNGERAVLKRVRMLDLKQSKYGCGTCKQRKVKCDENLPVCLRCSKSGRTCAGYDRISRSRVSSHQQHLTLLQPVGTPPWYQPEQQSMAQLTLALFTIDPHQLQDQTCAEFSSVLLPQLAATRPYVNASAAALGAAYDQCILHRAYHQDDQLITRLYVNALRQVQDELQRPDAELVPLLMAAMLLAAAESIQHKQMDALCHLLGAFSMINLQSAASPEPSHAPPLGPLARKRISEGFDSVHDVFRSVDYHISMFAWGRGPQFPPSPVTREMLYPASIDDLTRVHPALQQRSLHFIAEALDPKWEERIDFPPTLMAQRDYLIAWLKRWLRTYALLFVSPSSRSAPAQTAHFRILKAQALTMFIAISNIKPPTQVSYDNYAVHFEEIISCAEYVLNSNSPPNTPSSQPPPLLYSLVPGIIHPLLFTAHKYRHSISRRRAIHLLRHACIEGPFHGDFEARVAARLVEIEENSGPFKPVLAPSEELAPSAIADRSRVYLCWMVEPPGQEVGKRQISEMARRVVKFSRRRRKARGSSATKMYRQMVDVDGDGVVSAQRLFAGTSLCVQPDEYDALGEGELWEIWEEVVEGVWPGETESAH